MMNDKRNNTEDGAIDQHANQQNDSDRMDHPPELREANRLAVNELISGGGTFTPTRLLNIDGTDCKIEFSEYHTVEKQNYIKTCTPQFIQASSDWGENCELATAYEDR